MCTNFHCLFFFCFFFDIQLYPYLTYLTLVTLHHGNQSVETWVLDCIVCRLMEEVSEHNTKNQFLNNFVKKEVEKGSTLTVLFQVASHHDKTLLHYKSCIYDSLDLVDRIGTAERHALAGSDQPASKLPQAARPGREWERLKPPTCNLIPAKHGLYQR